MAAENVDRASGTNFAVRLVIFNSAILVCLVTIGLAVVCVIRDQTATNQQLAQIKSALLIGSNAMHRRLKLVDAALQQQQAAAQTAIDGKLSVQAYEISHLAAVQRHQTIVLYDALGKVIPVKMPKAFTSELTGAEHDATFLAIHAHLDRKRLDGAIAVVARLGRQLPPWAEQTYLPRFNALRWALKAEYLLARPTLETNPTAAGLSNAADELVNWRNAMPAPANGGVDATTLGTLAGRLKTKSRQFDTRATILAYHEARRNALACLNGASKNAAVALANLQPWLKDKNFGNDAEKLTNELLPLVYERQAGEIVKQLKRALPQLTKILGEQATVGADGRLADLQVSLAERGLAPDTVIESDLAVCTRKIKQFYAAQAAREAKMVRAYQEWALQEIKACASVYSNAQAQADGDWHNTQFKAVMFAAINHLLPIRRGDLTAAVAAEYSYEFNVVWTKLKGRKDQAQIAKEEAIVPQRSPSDIWQQEHGQ